MKIVKYKKKSNNKYEILLDNDKKFETYQEVILKYDLLLKKEIDIDLLKDIKESNMEYDAYYLALKYVTKKQRCEKEIREYLIKKEISNNYINNVIEKFKNEKILDEKSYILAYTKDSFYLRNDGPNKIKQNLLSLGLDRNKIDEYSIIDIEEQKNKLNKLIDKRLKQLKNYNGQILKRKIEEYFINKGYDRNIIDEVLDTKELYYDENYQKEYEKLRKKYEKKYSGNELEYFIKQKLYQKGFRK